MAGTGSPAAAVRLPVAVLAVDRSTGRYAPSWSLTVSGREDYEAGMSDLRALERFVQTDPRDVGCEQALAVLHIYVDLVLDDPSGNGAALRHPGVGTHPLACGPSAEDYLGLLALASEAVRP